MYLQRLGIVNERLKELDEEIINAGDDIIRTQALISAAPDSSSAPQVDISLRIILLQNTLPDYERNLTSLRNQKNELKLLLDNSKPFKIYDAPIRPNNPVGPKIMQIVVIAGMVSLIFGISLALMLEFLQKPRKEAQKC
jgi:uncharacterized protein involved in exopolysaccharide biosynthesis